MARAPVHCAVVGLGFGQLHCAEISGTPGLRLYAVCDEDPSRLGAAAAKHQAKAYSSYKALLRDPRLDLVVLVTPTQTHRPMALAAMKAGKHVIVEKPMALNVREVDAMLKARDKNGVMLSVHQNRRFDGDFMTLRSLLDRDLIGKAFLMEARVHFYGPWGGWRLFRKFGGGLMFDWGAHLVDQLLLLNPRQKVRSVYARYHYKVFGTEVENLASARLQFSNGNEGLAEVGQLHGLRLPRWFVLGEKGALRLDESRWSAPQAPRFEWHKAREKKGQLGSVPLLKDRWKSYYENVAAHLLKGSRLEVQAEQIRRVISVLEAAQRSAATGKAVSVE